MADHKTLIGGTAYTIAGGRTLVGGTGYDIASGRTLVGGTGYDVGFAEPVTITISTTSGNSNGLYVKYPGVGGTKYYTKNTSFPAQKGKILYCYVSGYNTRAIVLNGVEVATGSYNWVITGNATIKFSTNATYRGEIAITTT